MRRQRKGNGGKDLEGAILLAGRDYEAKQDGFALFHRPTPKAWDKKKRENVFTATAGVDFNGHTADGRPITFDAKETHEASWPVRDVTDEQLETLRRNKHGLSGLVIGFLPAWEVFWLPIVEIDQFLAAKWRESLSRDWCRAFGLHLPVDCRPSLRQKGRFVRHVRFLDGRPHADKNHSIARVNAERLTTAAQPDLFGDEPRVLHPYEEDPPPPKKLDRLLGSDPFSGEALARFGRKHGVKQKNWSSK